MLRHHEREPLPPSALNRPAEPNSCEQRLDAYLDRVTAALVEKLPEQRTIEIRREMRAHLDALIAANIELGSTMEEAVDHALRQFGSAKSVGGRWRALCEEGENSGSDRRSALRSAFFWFWLSGSITAAYAALVGCGICRSCGPLSLQTDILYASLFCMPFLAGYAVGMRARLLAVRCALFAQIVIAPLIVPVFTEVICLLTRHDRCPLVVDSWRPLIIVSIWMPILTGPGGCLGAFLGSRMRQRRARKLRIAH